MQYRRVMLAGLALAVTSLCAHGAEVGGSSNVPLPTVGPAWGPAMSGKAKPPLCTKRRHLGRKGYLVDQWWQVYRELERSSPLRKGWCKCARRCVPIDRLAAEYEKVAFAANAASVDLSIPPEQRKEYRKLAIEMFAERNVTVNSFRDCLDATRPPIQRSVAARGPIEGRCEKAELSLEDRWKLWCAAFTEQWKPIAAEFRAEFKAKPRGHYWLQVPLKATKNGKLRINGTPGWQDVGPKRRQYYIDKIKAITVDPFPEGTQWASWMWGTTFEVINGAENNHSWGEPMPCPKD